jgi:hypothetical protein
MPPTPTESPRVPPFGRHVEAFLARSLPAGKGGHVLAIGEAHHTHDYIDTLNEQWQNLSNPAKYNVGTLGLEQPTYINVVLWAMEDKRLPLSDPKKSADYLASVLNRLSIAGFQANIRASAELIEQAMANKTQVITFDMRHTLDITLVYHSQTMGLIKPYLPTSAKEQQALREDPKAFEQWKKEVVRKSAFVGDKEYIDHAWSLSEIKSLVDANPGYAARLQALEEVGRAAGREGLLEDGQSAAVLAHYADKSRNIITSGGLYHNTGKHIPEAEAQGGFAAHLAQRGLAVTPAIVTTDHDLRNLLSYVAPSEKGTPQNKVFQLYLENCAARAPMHLLVLDKDVVLDVSNPEKLSGIRGFFHLLGAEKEAKDVAKQLVESGARLTCDQPSLPTVAACAQQEAAGKGACKPISQR